MPEFARQQRVWRLPFEQARHELATTRNVGVIGGIEHNLDPLYANRVAPRRYLLVRDAGAIQGGEGSEGSKGAFAGS